MHQRIFTREMAEAANYSFELKVNGFLRKWIFGHEDGILFRFDQSLEQYLSNNALRDFFLHAVDPLKQLLQQKAIACHLGRTAEQVYFDPVSGDPLLAPSEQRIYNLAHRMESEQMHVPFRFIHPLKQTEAGDTADTIDYPVGSETIRYNSGNHFTSRPANANVFDQNSKVCLHRSGGNLSVLFKRGFLEERLEEVKRCALALSEVGEQAFQFFVICSRHSPKEGHFGASLVVMDPSNPHFPVRVFVCDTLLKDLPHHPRWWNHFVAEYANVFGEAIGEVIEDLSHPLQKVNIKDDQPYRHDWDCPYYVTSMTLALADIVSTNLNLVLKGDLKEVHDAMKILMQDYYELDGTIKDREAIKNINRLKRWNSGLQTVRELLSDVSSISSYEI